MVPPRRFERPTYGLGILKDAHLLGFLRILGGVSACLKHKMAVVGCKGRCEGFARGPALFYLQRYIYLTILPIRED